MKKIPKNKYTERLNVIYDDLQFDSDKRFLADIVFSNFVDVTEEVESVFDGGYDASDFLEMMELLSDSDTFMEILKETNSIQEFDLIMSILSLKTNLRHDCFDEIYRIIYIEDPLMKADVLKLRSFDKEFENLGKKTVWYNYLKKVHLYDAYIDTLNSNPQY